MTYDTTFRAVDVATVRDGRSLWARIRRVIQGIARPSIKEQRATGLGLLDQQRAQTLLVNPGAFEPFVDAGEFPLHRRTQRDFDRRARVAAGGKRINHLKGRIPA